MRILDESFYVAVTKLDIFLHCTYCKSGTYFCHALSENILEEFFRDYARKN